MTPFDPLEPLRTTARRLVEARARFSQPSPTARRWAHLPRVDQPLLLVSQVQRSGGTLLTRLFDGHPACWTLPHELHWASKPARLAPQWPILDPEAPPADWWDRLHQRWVRRLGHTGILAKETDRQRLVFAPGLHRQIFFTLCRVHPPRTRREVIDRYFTATFGAWLDCQGVYLRPKRYVVAFAPRLLVAPANRAEFRKDYPDGRIISIVRSPDTWLASALRFSLRAWPTGDGTQALSRWKESVRATLAARAEAPDRTLVMTFDDLVTRTALAMGAVCEFAGLPPVHAPEPTINGAAALSNSSFDAQFGIDPRAANRGEALTDDARVLIDDEAWALYAQATTAARIVAAAPRLDATVADAITFPGPPLTAVDRVVGLLRTGGANAARRISEPRVIVREPLLLISQIQRSGGTLLSRLFDGHPDCHAHPHELSWGYPKKAVWPDLPLEMAPAEWSLRLSQGWTRSRVGPQGYRKQEGNTLTYPFVFSESRFRRTFLSQVASRAIRHQRDILDAYLTAFFSAWLDYQGLAGGRPRRYVTAFTPGISTWPGSMDRYWRDYPDGHLISLVREPAAWFASAHRHHARYDELPEALAQWRASTAASLAAARARPDRVTVVLFDDLAGRTEAVMRLLCARTGLSFTTSMLTPTFNSIPVESNSSFTAAFGLDPSVRERASMLPPAERDAVRREAGDLFEHVCELVRGYDGVAGWTAR